MKFPRMLCMEVDFNLFNQKLSCFKVSFCYYPWFGPQLTYLFKTLVLMWLEPIVIILETSWNKGPNILIKVKYLTALFEVC